MEIIKKLEKYKSWKRQLNMLNMQLDRLYEHQMDIPCVMGKVKGSCRDFPYIEAHTSVLMDEPKVADEVRRKIAEKKARIAEIQTGMSEVEKFINDMPEGEYKQVFELYYLEGMRQREVAEAVGYTQGRISQIIREQLKD